MMRIEITTKERRLVFFLPLSLLGAQIVAKSIRRNLRDDRTHALASADEGAQSPILPPPADGQAEAAIASPEVLIPESGTPAGPESAPVPEAEAPHEDLPVGKLRPVFRCFVVP